MIPKKKLGDIAVIYNGNSINKTVKQQKYMKEVPGWNYIGTKDVDFDGSVTYKTGVVIPFSETQFRTAPAGTVFVCSEGGSAGKKTAIIKEEVCFGNKLCAIVNKDNLFIPQYIYYYTRYEAFLKQFKLMASTLMGGITAKNFGNIELPLPEIVEQQKIVARIEELFSSLDNATETLLKTKEQLEIYRQAVLKEAFAGRLTGSGKNGDGILGDYIEKPRYGTSKKCDYNSGETFKDVYRIPNIDAKTGIISHEDIKRAEFTEKELNDLDLKVGDILIIRSNGSPSIVGTAAMVRENDIDGTFAGYLMRLRIRDSKELLAKFLLFYLSSFEARTYIERVSKSTSGVNNINAQEVAKIPIPIFDVNDQITIVNEIESRISMYDQIEKTVEQALYQVEAMRQSVLKEAFEGRLA